MARSDRALSSRTSLAPYRVALALGALAAVAHARVQAPCAPALEYGMNPSFQTWSSRAIVFADAAQRVRQHFRWSAAGQPLEPAPLLAPGVLGAGWPDPAALGPGERYGAYLFGSMEGTLPDGRVEPYVVTWRGAGEVRLEGAYVAGERARSAQRVEVLVDPTRGTGNSVLSVAWTATSAADPVRDVRVWLPGTEATQPLFWPPFLAKVRAVSAGRGPHTWRTLDWTRVNEYGRPAARGGFLFDLAGAITPASPSQGTQRGVAPELQVALCNALGMNLHFQVPHRTDDLSESDWLRFVHRQLRVIRDGSPGVPGVNGGRAFAGLDPALTVTVELSNEIWNSRFPVHAWMEAEAARKGIPVAEQIAGEIQAVFDVADAVFSGADAKRLRTFVGGFVADAGWTRRILAELRPGTRVDALGPAAYLGPRRGEMDAWSEGASTSACPACPDADALLAVADASVDVLRPMIAAHRDVARGWTNADGSHPALVLYEAGVDFRSAGEPWAAAALEAHARPELFRVLADRFVPMLVEEGVALVNWYSFMTDHDPAALEPYGMWNDMEQALALPVTRPVVDQGLPKAALVCLGPPLGAACPPARASVRTAPGNLDVYAATAPALGRVFRAAVDLRPSGDHSAFVVASLLAASVPLPSGQTLLSTLSGAEFLPVRTGPIATWELALPNDPRLAGIEVATQAFLLGPGSVRLSNALDLTFGR